MAASEVAALAARVVAEREVARSGPRRHRAQANAERLRATWLAVRERVGAVVAGAGA